MFSPWGESLEKIDNSAAALFYDEVVRFGPEKAWRRYRDGTVPKGRSAITYSPRSLAQDGSIRKYERLAKSIGQKRGINHPDRIRFMPKNGKPARARGAPEDEIQTALATLIDALTPRTNGPAPYSPRPGIDFSVPLRRRITGEVNSSMRRGVTRFVLEEVPCEPCITAWLTFLLSVHRDRELWRYIALDEISWCSECLGTGIRRNRWIRVEISRAVFGRGKVVKESRSDRIAVKFPSDRDPRRFPLDCPHLFVAGARLSAEMPWGDVSPVYDMSKEYGPKAWFTGEWASEGRGSSSPEKIVGLECDSETPDESSPEGSEWEDEAEE